ncbi:DUF5820 family protein [Natronomonas sp. EA1]|uniref:DUF5820 family protein n=1 Tax=Natronomonas sp. EA1 TaxID=3421655 RepID=UPI003EB6C232
MDLPTGWQVWNEGAHKIVLVYRPDVFNGSEFPAPCLPTIYLTQGRRSRRPGAELTPDPETPWYVTLFLEPDVNDTEQSFDSREAALDGARAIARAFTEGDVDYRGLYQVPRERYFEKLDELTGRAD